MLYDVFNDAAVRIENPSQLRKISKAINDKLDIALVNTGASQYPFYFVGAQVGSVYVLTNCDEAFVKEQKKFAITVNRAVASIREGEGDS